MIALISNLSLNDLKDCDLEDLELVLEDGSVVSMKESYKKQIEFFKENSENLDKDWFFATEKGAFFLSKLGKTLLVVFKEKDKNGYPVGDVTRFHLRNGAIELQVNNETQNFEYKI